jgi:hypothetical protein
MDTHARTSQETLEITRATVEPRIQSERSQKVPVLRLGTTRPVNRAYLQPDRTGRVALYFRGMAYDVDDYLNESRFGTRAILGVTAGEFVCRQMLRDYGYQEEEWPALARQFLIKHTRRQLW